MARRKIILMSEPKKDRSSVAQIFSSLTAIITILTAALYLTGYLFLTGFYSAFNLPVSLVAVPTQNVLAVSAVLLIPVSTVGVVFSLFFVWRSGSVAAARRRFSQSEKTIWIYVAGYTIMLVFFIPPTGKWFALKQLSQSFSGYSPLSEPLPFVSIQCKQSLPGFPPAEIGAGGTATYKNLRLVAANDKYFFLYSNDNGTSIVPQDSVLWMRLSNQPMK